MPHFIRLRYYVVRNASLLVNVEHIVQVQPRTSLANEPDKQPAVLLLDASKVAPENRIVETSATVEEVMAALGDLVAIDLTKPRATFEQQEMRLTPPQELYVQAIESAGQRLSAAASAIRAGQKAARAAAIQLDIDTLFAEVRRHAAAIHGV